MSYVSRRPLQKCLDHLQRSLEVSISPKRSRLPLLRGVLTDVADAAEQVERAAEDFSVKWCGVHLLSCRVPMAAEARGKCSLQ